MTPAALCTLLMELPWDSYTAAELNELMAIGSRTIREIRKCQTAQRTAQLQQRLVESPAMTPEQVTAAMGLKHIYPAGSRHE